MTRPDFINWVRTLTQEQLKQEIERERDDQENRQRTLGEVQDRIAGLRRQLREERLTDKTDVIEARRTRIEQLRRVIAEFNKQIEEQKKRVAHYKRLYDEAQAALASLSTNITWESFLPHNQQRRETLRRRVAAYRGLVNSEQDLLDRLTAFRTSSVAEFAALNRWLRTEVTLQERLNSILGSIEFWSNNEREIRATIEEEAWRISYKLTLVVEGRLQRITVNYYIIIEEGEHDYPRDPSRRYRRKGGVAYRNKVRYPKGAFQAYLECDAFVENGSPREDKEPFPSLDRLMRVDVIEEFQKEFKNPTRDGSNPYESEDLKYHFMPGDLTLGIVSIRPKSEEVGKPPFKLYLERMSEGRGGWVKGVEEYLMTIEEYDRFTANMVEYRAALRRMP